MPGREGFFEGLRAGVKSEEEVAFEVLFPARDKFNRKQMLTQHQSGAMVPLSIMGVFRRMYKSNVLKVFQEELNDNKVALDRQGRIEASEIVVARRRAERDDEE